MAKTVNLLALDLGAESGRGVLGRFDGKKLTLEEVHRFRTGPTRVLGSLYWDMLHFFTEIKQTIGSSLAKAPDLAALGVDTWGVDFGLLDKRGELLGDPYHYRDPRTQGMLEAAFARVPREEIFEATGIQFMELNTLFQLLAMVIQGSPALGVADRLLTVPDLLNYWLTGTKVCEFSNTTTTQCYDPRAKDWARPMLGKLGIPTQFFGEVVAPGTSLGKLTAEVAEEVGGKALEVIAPATHDTGSAVAAVPAKGEDFAYLSSGTWSLMGAEVREPVIDEQALSYNFTNEGGVCDTFRLLKNIMGLWLVQECRRTWEQAGESLSYGEIVDLASGAPAFRSFVEPDHSSFLRPADMPAAIQEFCRSTGQPVPESKAAILRCVFESLALKYRWVLERLETLVGHKISVLHVVGGGSQNRLLNQFTANVIARPVLAGPVEATAIGNIMMQALAKGVVSSLDQARAVVRDSFALDAFEPKETAAWGEAYGRFQAVVGKGTHT